VITIRGVRKSDYDFVVSVLDRWWGGPSRELLHPIFFWELGERALIAEEEGAVVGFLFGFHAVGPPKTAYVHMVGIHPDHRRRGVGKELYEVLTMHEGCGARRAPPPRERAKHARENQNEATSGRSKSIAGGASALVAAALASSSSSASSSRMRSRPARAG
jgi:GNAT superfamily N-acetyltransferase